jgi:hypothetical protein
MKLLQNQLRERFEEICGSGYTDHIDGEVQWQAFARAVQNGKAVVILKRQGSCAETHILPARRLKLTQAA